MVAQSSVTPRAAQLIRNLAISDFFWFLAAVIQSVYWVFTDLSVPAGLCYFFSPIVNFMRMASLIWTCAISFDVLMSVNKRKWLWVSDKENWTYYRRLYYCTVLIFALPGTILNIIKQHSGSAADQDLGCNPGYEKIGEWYDVFFTELLPISIGFFANIYVYIQVREKMSQKAFPQSVRKRRRRIMYHYIIVCIICWTPTMVFYLSEIAGLHSSALEIIARSSLYLTGFLNFLVFGMQDPHLKRSFVVISQKLGCLCWCCCCIIGDSQDNGLKTREVDKTVMFGGHIEDNADVSKDKKNIYRYHKLTTEDKLVLYHDRPDLDPNVKIGRKKKDEAGSGKSSGNRSDNSRKKNRSIDFTSVKGMQDEDDDTDNTDDDDMSLNRSLLSKEERRERDAYENDSSHQSSEASDVENVIILASAHEQGNDQEQAQARELDCLPIASPERQSRLSKDQPIVISYEVPNNDHTLSPSSSHNANLQSEVIVADVENPAVTHVNVRLGSPGSPESGSQFAAGGGRRESSEDRINAARARGKQLRLGSDGPLISDEESFARSMEHIIDTRSSNDSGSMSRSMTHNDQQDSDSSGDEADEEDHALAERLDIVLPVSVATSNLLNSP